MKIKILFKSYFQLFFQNYLYLTLLFGILTFGLTADSLLGISPVKKYSLLLIGAFFLALLTTMNLYYNDSRQNKYLKQKINSSWADAGSQFLVALIINIFSGILIFIFSLILNPSLPFDLVGILALIAVGLLGSGIATLFKTQWYRHSSLGQVGVLVFIYLSLSGNVVEVLSYASWLLPPLSKIIMTLQNKSDILHLWPLIGQTFLYALILFLISSIIYKNNKKVK